MGKHQQGFTINARALGVFPEGCLVLEDSQAGVEAARTAGMYVIGLGFHKRVGKAQAVCPYLGNARLQTLLDVHGQWKADLAARNPLKRTSMPAGEGNQENRFTEGGKHAGSFK